MKKINSWKFYYKFAKIYYQEHGNIDINSSYVIVLDNGTIIRLGFWAINQIRYRNKGQLSKEKEKLLDDIHIKWYPKEERWDEYYDVLSEYYKKYGHTNVPKGYEVIVDGKIYKLYNWVRDQRSNYWDPNIPMDAGKILLLNDLEFDWSPKDTEFLYRDITSENESKYKEILESRTRSFFLDLVAEGYDITNPNSKKEMESILVDRIWNKATYFNSPWFENYGFFEKYYEKHGNINVPVKKVVDGADGDWLDIQRGIYNGIKKGILTLYKIKLLNKLNMDWSPRDTKILNSRITVDNAEKYNKTLLKRLNSTLTDLVNEGYNYIDSTKSCKELEAELVRRIWK